jgi:hypothetical protein
MPTFLVFVFIAFAGQKFFQAWVNFLGHEPDSRSSTQQHSDLAMGHFPAADNQNLLPGNSQKYRQVVHGVS